MNTITTSGPCGLLPCQRYTIAGIYDPDLRWWRRLWHRLLRRPPPLTDRLTVFEVTGFVGGNTFSIEPINHPRQEGARRESHGN